jgi:hypothetical protein
MSTNKHFDYEGGSINFIITDEGLIIDVYDHRGEPIATVGKMADEWAEWVLHTERVNQRLRVHDAIYGHGD